MTEIAAEVEALFPPRPGGMVDTIRKQHAAEQAQLDKIHGALAQPDASGYEAIRVREDPADLGVARTITLSSANKFAQLLPRDDARRTAVILAVDNDVWISYNQGTAEDLAGTSGAGSAFYLPAGLLCPVLSKAQLWVSPTTTASTSRVSVIISRDRQ